MARLSHRPGPGPGAAVAVLLLMAVSATAIPVNPDSVLDATAVDVPSLGEGRHEDQASIEASMTPLDRPSMASPITGTPETPGSPTRQAPDPVPGEVADAPKGISTEDVPVLRIQLEVIVKEVLVMGTPVEVWTYNGQVPGEIIRVTEGTRVEVTLVNGHSQTHSLHTHFRGNLIGSDGSSDTAPLPIVPHQHNPYPVEANPIGPYEPRHDRDVADPGQSHTYTFFADTPGQFIYHCHVWLATDHIERGLFGAFIVYPKGWTWEELPNDDFNGNTKAHVWDDRGRAYFEDIVFITELTPIAMPMTPPAVPVGQPITSEYPTAVPTSGFTPAATGKIHMANYRAWNAPYLVGPVQPNERIILRVVNLGDEMHDWHVHAHWFDVIDKTSREKKPLQTDDTWLLGPGDSIETHMTAGNPGHWFMHDHIVPEAYTGMVPWLWIAGDPVPNVPPDVTVDTIVDGAVVAGNVVILGTSDNFEGREMVQSVEVQVDDGDWQTADGLLQWRYVWSTTDVADGQHVLRFRSFDGRDYSPMQEMDVTVRNDASAPAPVFQETSANAASSLTLLAVLGAIGAAYVVYRRQ